MHPADSAPMPSLISGEGDDVEILEIEAVDDSGAPIEVDLAPVPADRHPIARAKAEDLDENPPAPESTEGLECPHCDVLRDRHRRLLAEFENYRVRSDREADGSRSDGAGAVLFELLPGIDNLERALGSLPEGTPAPVREGLELVLRQMRESMLRQGLEEVPALGEDFDPAVHEAVHVVDSLEHPDRIVVEQFQKGYLLKGRLLRPSLVIVARNPTSVSPGSAPDESEAEPWAE